METKDLSLGEQLLVSTCTCRIHQTLYFQHLPGFVPICSLFSMTSLTSVSGYVELVIFNKKKMFHSQMKLALMV